MIQCTRRATRVITTPNPPLELDQYIGNTDNRGRLWDNWNHRNNRQSMTIGGQSVPMFHYEVTHRIHLAMGSIGHPGNTIQGSVRYPPCCSSVSVFDEIMPFVYYLGSTIIIPGLESF